MEEKEKKPSRIETANYTDAKGNKIDLSVTSVDKSTMIKNWANEHDYPHPYVRTGISYRSDIIPQELSSGYTVKHESSQQQQRTTGGYYSNTTNIRRGNYQQQSYRGNNTRWSDRKYS